ncbi:hypothetical protein IWZ00DRAFT_549500 [Phyllosticta capitalensis]
MATLPKSKDGNVDYLKKQFGTSGAIIDDTIAQRGEDGSPKQLHEYSAGILTELKLAALREQDAAQFKARLLAKTQSNAGHRYKATGSNFLQLEDARQVTEDVAAEHSTTHAALIKERSSIGHKRKRSGNEVRATKRRRRTTTSTSGLFDRSRAPSFPLDDPRLYANITQYIPPADSGPRPSSPSPDAMAALDTFFSFSYAFAIYGFSFLPRSILIIIDSHPDSNTTPFLIYAQSSTAPFFFYGLSFFARGASFILHNIDHGTISIRLPIAPSSKRARTAVVTEFGMGVGDNTGSGLIE